MNNNGLMNKNCIIKSFASYLGERQIKFIKYLGDDLGYDWE
mgnify:CR=1 FL=1